MRVCVMLCTERYPGTRCTIGNMKSCRSGEMCVAVENIAYPICVCMRGYEPSPIHNIKKCVKKFIVVNETGIPFLDGKF